ncbi:hypothetical protein O181_015102 [Austropuccinia psidii MF-1]|uniref:Uncharacterized protein n=1 Tax=Austropuccinia psidii MF-1 TaxID=1389203 RepID=A0A9Q3C1H2_9BASI|nr:hypothetical protein [Austropuccinia psidii MF-1]
MARWTDVGGQIAFNGRLIYSSSEVRISRINTEGVVKRIRQISDSPPNMDSEGSDALYGEGAEVVNNSVGHTSSTFSFAASCQKIPKPPYSQYP